MSDRTEILESIRQLKAQHRDLRVEMSEAYKRLDWPKVARLAQLIQNNINSRTWRKKKLETLV